VFDAQKFTMSNQKQGDNERENCVFMAKLAEQAERYEGWHTLL